MSEKATTPAEQTNGMPTTGGKKVNVFAKAAGKAATITEKSKKTETVWQITPLVQPDAPTREQLDSAVSEMHRLNAERKAITTQEDVYKGLLKEFAQEQYIATLVKTGAEPPSPLKVANSSGKTVTFVVQDRGHLTSISDEKYEALRELLGDQADLIVYTGGEFVFDAQTMAQPSLVDGHTVQDVVAEAIGEALGGLVEAGKLRPEQVENLLSYKPVRKYKPGFFSRAVEVCGRNAARLAEFLGLIDSAVTRYVKV